MLTSNSSIKDWTLASEEPAKIKNGCGSRTLWDFYEELRRSLWRTFLLSRYHDEEASDHLTRQFYALILHTLSETPVLHSCSTVLPPCLAQKSDPSKTQIFIFPLKSEQGFFHQQFQAISLSCEGKIHQAKAKEVTPVSLTHCLSWRLYFRKYKQ